MNQLLERALEALRRGQIVLLYDADGREEETDMIVASRHATPEIVRTMRRDAGGLLCTTIANDHHERLGLPFLADLLSEASQRHPALAHLAPSDIAYDGSKPAFGLTINHRGTFTGITDDDRSLTITALADFLDHDGDAEAFGQMFRAPGHCTLLNGARGGLDVRQGHTELSLALGDMAGTGPSTTVCEMLDPTSGMALSRRDAEAYAAKNDLVFLTGKDVMEAWNQAIPAPTSA